jgi:transposase
VTTEVGECATTSEALLTVSEWLTEQQGPVVALARTRVYGRPLYHVLVGTVLLAGERDPKTLAALALGVWRRKQPPLARALPGQFPEHDAWLIRGAVERSARLDRQSADLDQHVGALMTPLAPQLEQLTSIPGVEATAARALLADIGTAMRHLGSAARLAAWAGVCPGNDARAGKRRAGRTHKGNRDLRRGLVQASRPSPGGQRAVGMP